MAPVMALDPAWAPSVATARAMTTAVAASELNFRRTFSRAGNISNPPRRAHSPLSVEPFGSGEGRSTEEERSSNAVRALPVGTSHLAVAGPIHAQRHAPRMRQGRQRHDGRAGENMCRGRVYRS